MITQLMKSKDARRRISLLLIFSISWVLSLVHFNCYGQSPGDLDTGFLADQARTNGIINTIGVQPDGKIVIGGSFTIVNGQARNRIARLNYDGSLDTGFLAGQTGVNDSEVASLGVQSDTNIVIGGFLTSVNGQGRSRIARMIADGSLDLGFLVGLAGANDRISSLAVQPNGKIVIGGSFTNVNGQARNRIARLNPNGSLDTAFLSGLAGPNSDVAGVAIQPDGKIVIVGSFTSVNGQGRNRIARLNSDGNLDSGFLAGQTGVVSFGVDSVAIQPDGKIIVGGWFSTVNDQPRNNIARLNADGSLDGGFLTANPGGASRSVGSIIVQPDGKILNAAGGSISRLLPDGNSDTGFVPGLTGSRTSLSLGIQPDGKVLVGVNFQTIGTGGGISLYNLTRLHGAPRYAIGQEMLRPPISFAPDTNNQTGPVSLPPDAFCWEQSQRKIYALTAGEFLIRWMDPRNQPLNVPVIIDPLPPKAGVIGQELQPPPGFDLSIVSDNGPPFSPSDAAIWNNPAHKLFAMREGTVAVTWGFSSNTCPRAPQSYLISWPSNSSLYQIHVAGTPAVALTNGGMFTYAQLFQDPGVGTDEQEVTSNLRFSAANPGRSAMLLSHGDPRVSTNFAFQFVNTVAWSDPAYLVDSNAVIGAAIVPPGLHDPTAGTPWVQNALSRYCAESNYWSSANRLGPLIPVNRDSTNTTADDLVVTYYQKGTKLVDPLTGNTVSTSIGWPYQAVRYQTAWPTNAPKITIGSGTGSGVLNGPEYQNWKLYVQNDPTLSGFNPNDEHAFVGTATNGLPTIFPLRDDLGTSETSEPFVLVTYQDGMDGNKPKVKVFQVEVGDPHYVGEAGKLLQPPYPLSLLQKSVESYGFSGPYWRDRKLDFWARAAGNDGAPTNIVVHWFYPTQPGFYFPSN